MLPDAAIDDAELLRRIQADDLEAFEVFFARHRGLIHRTALGLTGDPQAAEEVLQDTFLRAYRHRSILRLDISPVPWLYRVAMNLCYSRLGRRRLASEPLGPGTAEVPDQAPQPSEVAERRELGRAIRRGMAALPEKHRAVIDLYYLQGRSLQQTADILGIRLGTVKSRIHYALHALRGHLAEDGASDASPASATSAVIGSHAGGSDR
jgi:RNA polymerase sigma-70 factor (ECF subfamily)